MNKFAVRDQILAQLRSDLATQTNAAHLARDEAISEESRAQNQYDTHSQEAAYLAEAQARIAAEINESISCYQALTLPELSAGAPISVGALVELVARGRSSWYFIGPRAGGIEVSSEGQTVLVLTPQSPLGRQLLGKTSGDTVQVAGRQRNEEYRIGTVC